MGRDLEQTRHVMHTAVENAPLTVRRPTRRPGEGSPVGEPPGFSCRQVGPPDFGIAAAVGFKGQTGAVRRYSRAMVQAGGCNDLRRFCCGERTSRFQLKFPDIRVVQVSQEG